MATGGGDGMGGGGGGDVPPAGCNCTTIDASLPFLGIALLALRRRRVS